MNRLPPNLVWQLNLITRKFLLFLMNKDSFTTYLDTEDSCNGW